MERFIIILLLILIVSLTRYWRRKLGGAYCAAAKYAPTVELRREFSRKAVLAGNKEARKIFPITTHEVCRRPSAAKKCSRGRKSLAYSQTIISRQGITHT